MRPIHIHHVLSARIHQQAGLHHDGPPKRLLKYEDLRRSEWSPDFEMRMRNRLIMGALRYGLLHAPGKATYDRMASVKRRAAAYQETGNLELLVDVANLCLLEYCESRHPKRHFEAADDGEHVKAL